MLRRFNVRHINIGKAIIPNNLYKNRVYFTWAQVQVFILAGANTETEFIHVQACSNIRSLRHLRNRHQQLHILILIESTDRQICIKLDEQVKILAVGNPRKVSCVNYCRVIMCWRVDILMAISLLVRWFGNEMTLNPCSSLWNQLLFQTR